MLRSRWRGKLLTPVLVLVAIAVTYALTVWNRSSASTSLPAATPTAAVSLPAVTGPALRGPWALDPSAATIALLGFPSIGQATPMGAARAPGTDSAPSVAALDTQAATLLQHADLGAGLAAFGRADLVTGQALGMQPDDYRATVYRSWIRLAQRQYGAAAALAGRAIAAQPAAAVNYGILGDAALGLGRYDQAAAAYGSLARLQPGMVASVLGARLEWLQGKRRGALISFAHAVLAGDRRPALLAWSQAVYADAIFEDSGVLGAEQTYLAALRSDPRSPAALAGLARLRVGQGRLPEATVLLRRAVGLAPLPAYLTELADVYTLRGQREQAGASLQRAWDAYGQQSARGVDVALLRTEAALDHGRRVPDAAMVARRALASSQDSETADRAAWVLYLAGQSQPAWTAESGAINHGLKSATAYFHAGLILDRLHDPLTAFSYLRAAVMLNPNFSIQYAPSLGTALRRLAGRH